MRCCCGASDPGSDGAIEIAPNRKQKSPQRGRDADHRDDAGRRGPVPAGDQLQMIAIDARQPTVTPSRSPFDQCDVAPRAFSCSHFFDSGTNSRMKNTISAGSAPLIIRKRHPEFASRRLDHRGRHPDSQQQRFDAADEAVQADAQQADHQKSEIRGRADQPGNQRARFVRPDFVDQRDAERPLAAHAERGDEPQRRDVPRLGREAAESGEHRIREDAQRHRAHAPDAIAEPAEKHAAGRGADEEHGDDGAEPLRRLRRRLRVRADR